MAGKMPTPQPMGGGAWLGGGQGNVGRLRDLRRHPPLRSWHRIPGSHWIVKRQTRSEMNILVRVPLVGRCLGKGLRAGGTGWCGARSPGGSVSTCVFGRALVETTVRFRVVEVLEGAEIAASRSGERQTSSRGKPATSLLPTCWSNPPWRAPRCPRSRSGSVSRVRHYGRLQWQLSADPYDRLEASVFAVVHRCQPPCS